jgi:electron transfer flavoprotein alpha subunit
VLIADAPELGIYQPDPYCYVLSRLVRERQPEALLIGATDLGRDLAATLAARLNTGLAADCVALEVGPEGLLHQIVPVCGTAGLGVIVCRDRRPQMATVRPGALGRRPRQPRRGEIEMITVALPPDAVRTQVLAVEETGVAEVSLPEAEVVVAGGAGVGSEDGWAMLRELAEVLGGEVGGTRPAADDGFVPEACMIGQSGQTVRPKLYLGVGISGEQHHLVGIGDAQVVVAINRDPNAPIFAAADFAIVGDYREVLPELIRALR